MRHWEHIKTTFKKHQNSLIREVRFALIVVLWVGLFVFMMRQRWTQIEEQTLAKEFEKATHISVDNLEKNVVFWRSLSEDLARSLFPDDGKVNSEKIIWNNILKSRPEWLATHVVTKKTNSDPVVTYSFHSTELKKNLAKESSGDLPWTQEAHSAALQLSTSKSFKNSLLIQNVRSLDETNQWVQVLFKIKKQKTGESTFVVHTFSEHWLPDLQKSNKLQNTALYLPASKTFLYSNDFPKMKIQNTELTALAVPSPERSSGFRDQRFVMLRKNVWVSWMHSKSLNATLIRILPHTAIPKAGQHNNPSIYWEWIVSLAWFVVSAWALRWTHKQGLWQLNLRESPVPSDTDLNTGEAADPYGKNRHKTLKSALSSPVESEREFCRHMLSDVGPIGDLKLSGAAQAVVEVSPSSQYKGSWWIVQNLDEKRVLVAIGDASGQGLAAGTAAYSVKHFIEVIVSRECKSRDTESFLSLVYDLCSKATEGVLLGSAHVSLFAGIIELEQQKLCFLNAGFPSPLVKLGGKKKVSLSSHCDPIGLGSDTTPLPRWVNLTPHTEIVICNVGAQNTDLDELDESELVKIHLYPFGKDTQPESAVPADLEARAA